MPEHPTSLAGEENETYWSQRAKAQIAELRNNHPWADDEATCVVRHPSGEIHWWTFGGGAVNALLKEHLRAPTGIRSDNLAVRFPATSTVEDVAGQIAALLAGAIVPVPNVEAIENLKFGECLPPSIATEVFCSRFNAPDAIRNVLARAETTLFQPLTPTTHLETVGARHKCFCISPAIRVASLPEVGQIPYALSLPRIRCREEVSV